MGYLEITFGPMFSGKTSNLIERVNNYILFQDLNKRKSNILIINSSIDKRNINKIANLTTHKSLYNQDIFKDRTNTISVNNLKDIKEKILLVCDYIAIDECQFFNDLEVFVRYWLNKDKIIHCAGLIAYSDRKNFGQLKDIFCLADNIVHLKAFCMYCNTFEKTATFTKWCNKCCKNNVINPGAANKYMPVCGRHFNNF